MKSLTATAMLATALLLAGCNGAQAPAPQPATQATASQQEAVSRIGDVTIRASVLPTASLAAEIADQYGITRDEGTVMLLVGVRQGPDMQESALPAQITATATDLRGRRQDIVMRELRSGDASTGSALLDYVGTVEVSMPDTLRFDVVIVREGGASSTMQFTREFYPH
ncbi:DUF4426 domain-containing protein [Lysobacter fragariae]